MTSKLSKETLRVRESLKADHDAGRLTDNDYHDLIRLEEVTEKYARKWDSRKLAELSLGVFAAMKNLTVLVEPFGPLGSVASRPLRRNIQKLAVMAAEAIKPTPPEGYKEDLQAFAEEVGAIDRRMEDSPAANDTADGLVVPERAL